MHAEKEGGGAERRKRGGGKGWGGGGGGGKIGIRPYVFMCFSFSATHFWRPAERERATEGAEEALRIHGATEVKEGETRSPSDCREHKRRTVDKLELRDLPVAIGVEVVHPVVDVANGEGVGGDGEARQERVELSCVPRARVEGKRGSSEEGFRVVDQIKAETTPSGAPRLLLRCSPSSLFPQTLKPYQPFFPSSTQSMSEPRPTFSQWSRSCPRQSGGRGCRRSSC